LLIPISATYTPTGGSLADPVGSSALVAAVQWLERTILGTAATTVAVISIATIGFMMLSGRVDLRRGATVVIGCFILFGAAGIAAGIKAAATGQSGFVESGAVAVSEPPPQDLLITLPGADRRNAPADPYAGAAVPVP
jgi:type IV secretion system protein VirB2